MKLKLYRAESGQSIVAVALLLAVLCGCVAMGVDLGAAHIAKQRMQNAADLAAMAGAKKLYSSAEARQEAVSIAMDNGVKEEGVEVTTPYDGDPYSIEVVCTEHIVYKFAQLIGFKETDVSGRAAARFKCTWDGEAFPLYNKDTPYEIGKQMVLWNKNDPGSFERLQNSDFTIVDIPAFGDHKKGYKAITIDFSKDPPIHHKNGKANDIKGVIQDMYDMQAPGQKFYVFSLRNDIIESGKYSGSNVGNGTPFYKDELVLLECTYDYYKNMVIGITVTDIYDFNNGDTPTEFLYDMTSGYPELIE